MPKHRTILHIAVPSPIHRVFDYLPPAGLSKDSLLPGIRVRVPFGRGKTCIGILINISNKTEIDPSRLKRAIEIVDTQPTFDKDTFGLITWASDYYQHPIGEAFTTALPVYLRSGKPAIATGIRTWHLTDAGKNTEPGSLARAPRQADIITLLTTYPGGIRREQLDTYSENWQNAMRALIEKGLVETREQDEPAQNATRKIDSQLILNPAQTDAVEKIAACFGQFQAFLLHGVTGSGKTEVYLQVIEKVLAKGQQVLVLVPEIGLTPQLIKRFQERFNIDLAIMHSGLTDRERFNGWLAARDGQAPIIIGTRSAVFTPMKNPGLVIIDEEHDISLKQQDGFRYNARDIAIKRAKSLGIPVILGSATPSLESLQNAINSRYEMLKLPERAGAAIHPVMLLLDVRGKLMDEGISMPLIEKIRQHLAQQGQVLLFLNRRGYAPTLLCHDCGWVAECHRCDAHMTLHKASNRLRCHHCGAERPVETTCPACQSEDMRAVGAGTERTEQTLQQHFPDTDIIRIDRDTTRRKGSMESMLKEVHDGSNQILIGTQLLAKGHHFPNVTLAGILDSDHGLFSADFRAGERMAQLVLQVAGRAGRAEKPGEVIIQTHHPEHPLLQLLVSQDYDRFAEAALEERRMSRLPPFSNLALLRAEAKDKDLPYQFLQESRDHALVYAAGKVDLFGPVPAPMERRAGNYRAQLLLQADNRPDLHRLLKQWIPILEQLKSARKVRWSLDVDPMEML
jgi:primosomal protein N' (replication factor Y)